MHVNAKIKHIIEKIRDKGMLDDKQSGLLKEANGLRNRLVHEYNGIEKRIAIESIKDKFSDRSSLRGG